MPGRNDGDHPPSELQHFETVVIGGGQAGLSVGYHLARRDGSFVILDAKRADR
jgi:putative flavoprotein involved in K+ transport